MSRNIHFINGEKREVKSIYCLGRNYAEHTKEMKGDLNDKPIIFIKPATALPVGVDHKNGIELPYYSNNVHHEVELVIAVSKGGYQIEAQNAFDYIDGLGIGLDLTLRDIQDIAKQKSHPWAIAKGFKNSAPISKFLKLNQGKIENYDFGLDNLTFTLKINTNLRQIGHSKDMILDVAQIVEYISSIFELQEGDLIFTGTPKGVDQVASGDSATCEIDNLIKCEVNFI
jgi:2-keto-4-pentenoate hydratase/2-oxohepta-3-ene-1,7-dioic acid hydratase in catechol pathway